MGRSVGAPSDLSSCSMPFIVSSNVDKVDPATRKLIRRHVMRGKKRKKTDELHADDVAPAASIQTHSTQMKLQEIVDMYTVLQPGCSGAHRYFVAYPDQIDPLMLWNMKQVSTVAMRIIFPLLTELGSHAEGNAWHSPLGHDAAAFHINAFAVQSFIDKVLRHQSEAVFNPLAMLHYQKGLELIRKRLDGDDEAAKISDSTIGVILKLASTAQFSGHVVIAQQHMRGLWKMAHLRGGLIVFQDNPKLLVEMWRCDLGIALLANSDPVFYRQPAEKLPDYPEQVLSSFSHSTFTREDFQLVQNMDRCLGELWLVMRKFSLLANLGTQTRMLMEPATIYGTMIAVMYRLLRMKFKAGTLDESIRLGLLAFTNHIFLEWQDMKLPYNHSFSGSYRTYLQLYALGDIIPPQISLWLLMIGAISSFSVTDEVVLAYYLREQADRCRVTTWRDGQRVLKSSMWISQLDDKSGKQIYDVLTTMSGSVS